MVETLKRRAPRLRRPDHGVHFLPNLVETLHFLFFERDLIGVGRVLRLPTRGAGEQRASGSSERAEHVFFFGSQGFTVHVDGHGDVFEGGDVQLLPGNGADGSVLDGNHVEDAAGEQRAIADVLDERELAGGPQSAPLLMILVELQMAGHAAPLVEGGGIFVFEAAGEIVIEGDDPAGSDHGGVANHLQVAFAGDRSFGRRQVADPERRIAPGLHGADETCVGIDPGSAGRAGFGVAVFHHLDACPYALVGGEDRRCPTELEAAARGELDDDGLGVRYRRHAHARRPSGKSPSRTRPVTRARIAWRAAAAKSPLGPRIASVAICLAAAWVANVEIASACSGFHLSSRQC